MVDILNTSLFSVRWDLRSVWSILTLGAQIYLLVFLGAAVFAIIRCARILWSLKQMRHGSGQETGMILARFEWRIHSLRQLLVLALLVFGVILANEIFASLRAVQFSYMSLSEYSLREALEVPTAFAFFSLSSFVCLHALQWFVDMKIQRRLRHK